MSSRKMTEWTCDRCGFVEYTEDIIHRESSWDDALYYRSVIPEEWGAPQDHIDGKSLCKGCAKEYNELVNELKEKTENFLKVKHE